MLEGFLGRPEYFSLIDNTNTGQVTFISFPKLLEYVAQSGLYFRVLVIFERINIMLLFVM